MVEILHIAIPSLCFLAGVEILHGLQMIFHIVNHLPGLPVFPVQLLIIMVAKLIFPLIKRQLLLQPPGADEMGKQIEKVHVHQKDRHDIGRQKLHPVELQVNAAYFRQRSNIKKTEPRQNQDR